MLTASLASLPEANGFKAYDCRNSGNPVEMYSWMWPFTMWWNKYCTEK